MCAIRIVTDSTADIPKEASRRLGIEVVPLKVIFGNETYLDGVTIDSGQFYDKLTSSAALPTTSQPSPVEFVDVYQRIFQEDPDAQILSFHVSSALSGTYQSALLAKSMLDGNPDITVIDTKTVCQALGITVTAAAEWAKEGFSANEIVIKSDGLRRDIKLYFMVDTLEYLHKGGRIGKASALFGSILNIKPILSVSDEGLVYPVDKVRGSKKAMQRIVELLKDEFGSDPVAVTLDWASTKEPAEELGKLIESQFDVHRMHYSTIGAVIGTHVGPGAVAVFMNRV
jgi:DegV family protein with EDD domain